MKTHLTFSHRSLLALAVACCVACTAGCSKDEPTAKASAGKTDKASNGKRGVGEKKPDKKAADQAKEGDKAAKGDKADETAKVDKAAEVAKAAEGDKVAQGDNVAEGDKVAPGDNAETPEEAGAPGKDENAAEAPADQGLAAKAAGTIEAGKEEAVEAPIEHPTYLAAAAPVAEPPPAPVPTPAPPPPAAAGNQRDPGPPLDITGYLSAADLERVLGNKLKFRRRNLAGVKPHKGYNALYYADAKGKEFGVSVQVWRDRNLVDSRTRYNTMRNTYSEVVETNRVTAQGFRSFYGNVVSLVFADPRRPMLASVSCSIKFCTADSVIELSRRVAGRMR